MVLPSHPFSPENFLQQDQPKEQTITQARSAQSFWPPQLGFPVFSPRNFEDEAVALHPFHSPIKTVPTRMSLRGWLWAAERGERYTAPRKEEKPQLLPCVFHPVIQKKSQYCSPAGACREPNLSALVARKLLMASPFPRTKKGKEKKEGFLNSCLGSLTSSFGSAAQRQLVPACSVFYLKQRCF